MNKYLCNWRKANLSNNHFSSIKTMFKRAIHNIVQSEKKVTLIHFWSIKYKLYVVCVCACVHVCVCTLSCPVLSNSCDPMYSPGSSVHRIFQARK